jgi:hypothetical protein
VEDDMEEEVRGIRGWRRDGGEVEDGGLGHEGG